MRYLVGMLLVFCCASLASAATVAVKIHTAELRDSYDPYVSRVELMLPRYYPLTVESEKGDYLKVSDFRGNSGWIARSDTYQPQANDANLPETVVVTSNGINVRSGPGLDNKVVMRAERGVAFKLLQRQGAWLQVEHESGAKGWIHRDLTWGD